jgi:hypothetical protein
MSPPLLPTDSCPRCYTERVTTHPFRVVTGTGGGDGLRAWYRCPRCRYSWWCSWGIDALALPCPGCDLCQPGQQQGVA